MVAELALAVAGVTVQVVGLLVLFECLVVGVLLIWWGVRGAQTLPNPLAVILTGVAVILVGVAGLLLGW